MKQIGLYIHIPFCKRKCFYCDFNSYENRLGQVQAYIETLSKEIDMYREENKFIFKTVYIGGGTPSIINYPYIGKIMDSIAVSAEKDAEITMECNPGTVTQESLNYYRKAGINRLSIGLQAWQPPLLERIGRIHGIEDFKACFAMARTAGFKNINVDLMFCLPGQTIEMWEETLKRISEMGPEHLSCYGLKLEEGTKLYRWFQEGKVMLPDEDADREMYYKAGEVLAQYGYHQYEISNYARDGFQCRHNLIYWHNGEYLGVGAGSHSKLADRRFWNYKELDKYIESIENGRLPEEGAETVGREEEMWETVFLALRLNSGISMAAFEERYGIRFEERYGERINRLTEKGLVKKKGGTISLTPKGRDLSNLVFIELM